ncbi:FKBP-type peptidyl-prolyl cis-trans isomerase [Microbacterium phosphatis]|uniref:FKBP-type peptidyl-prolyl cis-trans isomerase n=1 Tax=Microbacterium phosphatis TaxID=3140248 RepID=UPI0031400D16
MRRSSAVLSITALLGLSLVGCAPAGTAQATCDRVADSDPETMRLLEVTGDLDSAPRLDARTPFVAESDAYADIERGDGPLITHLDQPGVLDITLFDGETGSPLIGTAYDGDLTALGPLSGWTSQFPAFEDALMCATEGSRIAVAISDEGISDEVRAQYAQAGIPEEGSLIAVLDVRKVLPRAASGDVQFNAGLGLPTVVRTPDGVPGVIVPDADAPTKVVTQTLIKGDGAALTAQDAPIVQYTAVSWDGREVTDSTWGGGDTPAAPTQIVPGQFGEGFAKALEGQTVGSQVMVVVPDGLGPETGAAPFRDGETIVFVVDILGTLPAAQ